MSTAIRPVRPNPAPVYKLTDEAMRTYCGFQWTLGKTYVTSGTGDLCSAGWLHCYADPRLAVLLNPIHADFRTPRLFEAVPGGVYRSDGLKAGCSRLTLTRELTLPLVTTRGRILFAIACTRAVLSRGVIPEWDHWADAYIARDSAAWSATTSAADAALSAAWNAASAAESAAWSAARSAADAAWSATSAAESAAESAAIFSLVAIVNTVNLAEAE